MISVEMITHLHQTTVQRWHEHDIDHASDAHPNDGLLLLIGRQHEQNFRLWHEEDIARSVDVSDAALAQVKRNIDGLNQQRNDLIEQIDDCLIAKADKTGTPPAPDARLNTETPGSVIDRLSILALRIYHMDEQAARSDADEQHRLKARGRLKILHEQHADLSAALEELVDDIFSGRKQLKVYRQFKMYNDPTMNPCLYASEEKPAA